MDTIKKKFTCKECEDLILEEAVYLPCFETICKAHLKGDDYKCDFCNATHRVADFCRRDNDIINEIVKKDGHLYEIEIELKNYSLINYC